MSGITYSAAARILPSVVREGSILQVAAEAEVVLQKKVREGEVEEEVVVDQALFFPAEVCTLLKQVVHCTASCRRTKTSLADNFARLRTCTVSVPVFR